MNYYGKDVFHGDGDDYKLSESESGTLLAVGSQRQMFSFVKHEVEDGAYCINGPDSFRLWCLRTNGDIGPDFRGYCTDLRDMVCGWEAYSGVR